MSNSSQQSLPVPIRQKLGELRSLISRLIATQGAVVLASWLLGSFLLFGLIDYLPTRFGSDESPRIVRIVMLGLIAAGTIWILVHFYWNRWLVHWSDSSLALVIEKQHPEFQSTLITTVQARGADAKGIAPKSQSKSQSKSLSKTKTRDFEEIEHPNRPGMIELAARKAVDLIQKIDVNSLVRFATLQRELGLFAALVTLVTAGWMFAPDYLKHWTKRLYTLSDQPWPRRTTLGLVGVELDVPSFTSTPKRDKYLVSFQDGKVSVPKGSSLKLRTTAKDLLAAPYDKCSFQYRDRSGNRGRASMLSYSTSNPKEFSLDGPPLEAINESLWFTLSGGDARLANLQIETVDAPFAVSTEVDVAYPQYLQRSTKTTWGNERLPYRNGMRLPQATDVSLWVRANKPISRCDIQRTGSQVASSSAAQVASGSEVIPVRPEYSIEFDKPASEFPVPLGLLEDNLFIEIRLWDDQGLCATRVQQFVIASIVDTPPEIDMKLEGIGSAITENAMIPIRSKVKDDYDLNQVWVESIIDEQPLARVDVQVTPQGNADLDVDLKAMRDAGQSVPSVGSTLALLVAASDFMPSSSVVGASQVPGGDGKQESVDGVVGEAKPHTGRSTPIQLSVVTVDQFLVLIDRREAAMRRRLEQIISELGQLRDLLVLTNKNNTESTSADSQKSATDSTGDTGAGSVVVDESEGSKESDVERRGRLLLLRAQQASAQAGKSESELKGVLNEISQLVAELINNRIDSKDRRERLEEKIKIPLSSLMEAQWQPFTSEINGLEPAAAKASSVEFSDRIEKLIGQNNEIIVALNAILSDMIELQDLNEIIDRVRGLLDEQSKLLDRSKEEQKKSVLDLLK